MKINKRLVLVLVVLLLALNAFNFAVILLTGNAITTGTTSLCFNYPPVIAVLSNARADHNFPFIMQVNASDPRNESLLYSDDTNLFDIGNLTGLINFIPTLTQVRNYSVRIFVRDYLTACPITRSANFSLEVYNLPPNLTTIVPPQIWETDVWLTGLNLNNYFTDPEHDPLTFKVEHGDNVDIAITPEGMVTFYPFYGWNGKSWALFKANDTLATTFSNQIDLTIGDYLPPRIALLSPQQLELRPNLKLELRVVLSEIGNVTYNLDNKGNRTLAIYSTRVFRNITLPYFGQHNLVISAVDRYGNRNSTSYNFTILQDYYGKGTPDNDTNSVETLKGTINDLNTNIPALNLNIGGNANFTANLSGTKTVEFTKNGTVPLLEFPFYFGNGSRLNFGEIIIEEEEPTQQFGSMIVRGINLSAGMTKTIYVNRRNGSDAICIKDSDISSLEELSSSCNGSDEYIVSCPGNNGNYNCSTLGGKYKVSGLLHSGVTEMEAIPLPASSSSSSSSSSSGGAGGGGGGGGGGGSSQTMVRVVKVMEKPVCEPYLECNSWGPKKCGASAKQERACLQVLINCGILEKKEERDCQCEPQWLCTTWQPDNCPANEEQSRSCYDVNECGKEVNVPLTQRCAYTSSPAAIPKESKLWATGKAFWNGAKRLGMDGGMYWMLSSLLLLLVLLTYVRNGFKNNHDNQHENKK